jgi:hypothetical protein
MHTLVQTPLVSSLPNGTHLVLPLSVLFVIHD